MRIQTRLLAIKIAFISRIKVYLWRMRIDLENLLGISKRKERKFFKEVKEL